jgi:ubiquinone/menaquinone biosynthesis C-methylase UbiE
MVDRRDVRDAYDDIAAEYETLRDDVPAELSMLDDLVDPLPSDARVLDAGCGSGVPAAAHVADRVAVTGLDFSERQLTLAADRVPGASLVRGDMTELPFADGTFDALYSLYAVIHVPRARHRACFAEFRRVLRTGAPVLVTVGTDDWAGSNDDWMGLGAEMHWEIPGLERTADLLEDVGFELEGHEVVADDVSEEEGVQAFVRARAVARDA